MVFNLHFVCYFKDYVLCVVYRHVVPLHCYWNFSTFTQFQVSAIAGNHLAGINLRSATLIFCLNLLVRRRRCATRCGLLNDVKCPLGTVFSFQLISPNLDHKKTAFAGHIHLFFALTVVNCR